jgi:uncharacterized membrane protein YdbT with pleckstrin-like domain
MSHTGHFDPGSAESQPTSRRGIAGTEEVIWTGTPSQWVNFWPFVIALAIIAGSIIAAVRLGEPLAALGAVLGLLIAFWPWLQTRCTNIHVTTERIGLRTGVFTRRKRDMELYRVKDTTLHEPFFMRMVGLANIELVSSDKTTPFLVLPAIRGAESLREKIRMNVERMRMDRRVRELDFE